MKHLKWTLTALALVGLLAAVPAARAASVDPLIFISFKSFNFKPTKFKPGKPPKPGQLRFSTGKVTLARYSDGTTTTVDDPFDQFGVLERIIGAQVKISNLVQDVNDPFSFLNATVMISAKKTLFIDGDLINISFDPGSDVTDGIVTLNLGFRLDNLIFSEFNQTAGSRFITEYATMSSQKGGALAITLRSPIDPRKLIDGFDRKSKGTATAEFQIPEPGTLVLLLAGVAGLVRIRRRS